MDNVRSISSTPICATLFLDIQLVNFSSVAVPTCLRDLRTNLESPQGAVFINKWNFTSSRSLYRPPPEFTSKIDLLAVSGKDDNDWKKCLDIVYWLWSATTIFYHKNNLYKTKVRRNYDRSETATYYRLQTKPTKLLPYHMLIK